MDIGTVVSLFEIALGAVVLLFLVLIFSSMLPDARRFSEGIDLSGLLCLEFNIPAW